MRDVSLHVNVSWNVHVYGVSDTVEKRTCLPSALGQTLQHLSAHRIIYSSYTLYVNITEIHVFL